MSRHSVARHALRATLLLIIAAPGFAAAPG
jgi:hypothetical protein